MSSNKKKNRRKGKVKEKTTKENAAAAAANTNADMNVMVATENSGTPHQVLLRVGRGLMLSAADQENSPCTHGLPSLNLDDQPEVKTFLSKFFDEIEKRDDGGHLVNAAALAMQEVLPKTPVTSLTKETHSLIVRWLVCIGVTCLREVKSIDGSNENDPAAAMALATLELDDFCSAFFSDLSKSDESMTVLTSDGRGKVRDLLCGGERALTKFFRRRITCDCLDSKYEEVKPLPRTGSCSWCMSRKKLKELKICSGCNVCHYCSRECQLKSWPTHKAFCGNYLSDILAKVTLSTPTVVRNALDADDAVSNNL